MTRFMKCDLCNVEISGEKCVFAVHKRTRGGEDHYFCCERHADEFDKTYGIESEKTEG
jgi:YHS domain-containing protein